MILEKLVLENYKQFRERVELAPPEGAVGIVGGNGSGKTTIFESILWAFFGSRGRDPRFSNDSIPFSGGSTAERSTVEVTLNVGGAPYRVVRSLHRGKTEARAHVHDEEIVGGPSEVTEWVQQNLLGMNRDAFEATFFARQKELEFFAGVTGVKRQREIARILGIDQVEGAQDLLRTDKRDRQKEADLLAARLEDVDHEGLVEESKEAREEYVRLEAEAGALEEKLTTAGEELTAARAEGERLEADYRRHNELSGLLAAAESARARAAEKAAELRERLSGLDEDEKTVRGLLPETERLPAVAAEVEGLEEARRRRDLRELARKEVRRLRVEAHRVVNQASDLIEDLDGAGDAPLPGWEDLFSIEDEAGRMRAAERLLQGADGTHRRAEEELRRLEEAGRRHEELRRAEGELAEARMDREAGEAEVERVNNMIQSVTGGIMVEEIIAGLRKKEGRLQRQAAQQKGYAEADEREAEKLAKARRMIEVSEVSECPTCQRGFGADEHAEVLEALLEKEEEILARAREARAECRHLDGEAKDLGTELKEAEELGARASALEQERTVAEARWEKHKEMLRTIETRVEDLRRGLAGVDPVADGDLREAGQRVERLRALRDAYPKMQGFVSAYEEALESAAGHAAEAEALAGGPDYDPDRHERLGEEISRLQRLLGRVERLREQLGERPGVEERLAAAVAEEERAGREAGDLRAGIEELGFDDEAYRANRERARVAEEAREELRRVREELAEKLRQGAGRIESLWAEISRYEEQRKVADEKERLAKRLGQMDRLLSEFYRELTARVRPVLEEEASGLVKTLTDGRYERVEFDQNYGVRLFDGLSDAYELSRFSGGEADVVSLAARVALSKMVAARGQEAMGFLVLDEVFGALDADRRRNVLLALDRLKKAFGQIFVISHVADVQESSLLDELWLVEEDEEGRSTVRPLNISARVPEALLENAASGL